MKKITNAPMKYVQDKGELFRLYEHISILCNKKALLLVDPFVLETYGSKIESGFVGKLPIQLTPFGGESSKNEIDRVVALQKQTQCDFIVGIGGGKTLDTAKAVGYYADLPVAVVPTAASSDAPCSALSVLYNDDGSFHSYLPLKSSPMVLVDTQVVAEAPARLFAAGMGDALATFYEARSCYTSRSLTVAGGTCSLAALSLACSCRDSLFMDGYKALLAVEQNTVTQAVENIIETNIYLSGIGFESGGLAAAHALHDGLTLLKETHPMLHGEKVAFGTLVHLVLENAPEDEIGQVLSFCRSIGLPTNLAMLGVENPSPEDIMAVAISSCEADKPMHNMPFPVTPEDVYSAILVADKLGQSFC